MGETILSPLNRVGILFKTQLTIDAWIHFWPLNSILLVYMPTLVPVPPVECNLKEDLYDSIWKMVCWVQSLDTGTVVERAIPKPNHKTTRVSLGSNRDDKDMGRYLGAFLAPQLAEHGHNWNQQARKESRIILFLAWIVVPVVPVTFSGREYESLIWGKGGKFYFGFFRFEMP